MDFKIDLGFRIYKDVHPKILEIFKNQYSIFLVGGNAKDKQTMRYKIMLELEKTKNINAYLPEDLFDDPIFWEKYNLLSLENLLAESVSAVVMAIESKGSIAELGAFSNHKTLMHKLVVLMNSKYISMDSFINLGPIQYLKSETRSSVIWMDYKTDISVYKFELLSQIRRIKKNSKSLSGNSLTNLLFCEKFLLALVYSFGSIQRKDIINIIKKIDGRRPKSQVEKAITNADILLESSNFVKYSKDGIDSFSLSDKGRARLNRQFGAKFVNKHLDNIRLEVLNLELRKFWV